MITVRISDDGVGGADPAAGTGLNGLRDRVRAVDGSLYLTSPLGGPTVLTITLPDRRPRPDPEPQRSSVPGAAQPAVPSPVQATQEEAPDADQAAPEASQEADQAASEASQEVDQAAHEPSQDADPTAQHATPDADRSQP